MIDPTRDELLTLPEAARTLPRVGGKRPSCTTLWRWCCKGIGPDRIRLEHVRVGRRVVTTREALGRFMAATAEAAADRLTPPAAMPAPKPRTRTDKQRQRAVADAMAELRAAGVVDADTCATVDARAAMGGC